MKTKHALLLSLSIAALSLRVAAQEYGPWHVGVSYVAQEQDYDLTRITIPSLPPMAVAGLTGNLNTIENEAETVLLRLTYTPHPAVNLFLQAGAVDGSVKVRLQAPFQDVEADYDGLVYGPGVTLNYGTDCTFVALTASYTYADLDDATIETFVFTPKIGLHDADNAVWIGAQYQRTDHSQEGSIPLPPFGAVSFDVDLEDEQNWSALAGASFGLGKGMLLTLEAGFADREQYLISFELPF